MHVLFVARHYFGNPDLVRLTAELAERGHRVSVASSLRKIDRYVQKENVDFIVIKPLLAIQSIPYSLSFPFSRIYKFVKRENVEIIHALMDYSTNSAFAALVSRITDTPFVYTVQGMGTRTGHIVVDAVVECYDWAVERLIVRNAAKIILLSKSLFSLIRKLGVGEDNVVTIPSAVDHKHFDPERPEIEGKASSLRKTLGLENRIVIGYVGRLVPAKGLTYLISAVERLQSEYSKIALLIVGDGPLRKELESMTEHFDVDVVFAGWQSDIAPYYAVMDIFVLPSLFEGLPNVLLEAMAMGKAVVATDVGGNSDLVFDGDNGFLVSVRDSEQIASALRKLISDDGLRRRMGVRSRQIVTESFVWSKTVRMVEKVYNEIV